MREKLKYIARKHLPVNIWIVSTIADRILTIPFFSLENNPLTVALGIYRWLGLTIFLLGFALIVWHYFELYENRLMRIFIWIMAFATTFITVIQCYVTVFYLI